MKEIHRPQLGSGRSSRFLSDDSAVAYCRAAGTEDNACSSDVFSGITERALAAAPASKIFSGKIKKGMSYTHNCSFEILCSFNHMFCLFCITFCNKCLYLSY